MSTEGIDYKAVLLDLETKKAAIDATIIGVRQMLNVGADQTVGGTAAPTSERKEQATEVRFDSFFGMSMPDAITKFLEISKRPQTVSDITKALQDGGFPTTAKNLISSVGSTLTRMKTAGDVVSVSGKWGISAWYPALRRERVDAVQKANGAKSKKKKSKTKAAMKSSEPKPSSPQPTAEQIERIKALHAEGKKPGEIGKAVGVHHFTVLRVLNQKAEKKTA
jgi:hypothetical protein